MGETNEALLERQAAKAAQVGHDRCPVLWQVIFAGACKLSAPASDLRPVALLLPQEALTCTPFATADFGLDHIAERSRYDDPTSHANRDALKRRSGGY